MKDNLIPALLQLFEEYVNKKNGRFFFNLFFVIFIYVYAWICHITVWKLNWVST